MSVSYTVYMLINRVNDKKYIGITSKCPEQRWRSGCGYSKRQPLIYNAIKKYGWDNFDHIILKTGLAEDAAKSEEQRLIKLYDTMNPKAGYNMTIGGDGHIIYRTEEERSAARKATVERRLNKIITDPEVHQQVKDLANKNARKRYKAIKENDPVRYARIKKVKLEQMRAYKEDPMMHEKVLASKRKNALKAKQDPEKHRKRLEANRRFKNAVRAVREELIFLYKLYPNLFSEDDCRVCFTKFSSKGGCYKYNSIRELTTILDKLKMLVEANNDKQSNKNNINNV